MSTLILTSSIQDQDGMDRCLAEAQFVAFATAALANEHTALYEGSRTVEEGTDAAQPDLRGELGTKMRY